MKYMEIKRALSGIAVGLGMVLTLVVGPVGAQQVYRCEQASGSVTFSDLPCRSDVGREGRMDATPHQGHRFVSAPAVVGALPARARSAGAERRTPEADPPLGRNERLALERRRAELLSGLKRRHVRPDRRRVMIAELRGVDRQLDIGPADVADMPFHNREIYEDNRVFGPGKP